MAKRFGRTLVSSGAAREYSFKAHLTGSDHADLSGNCTSPVMVSLTGQASRANWRLRVSALSDEYDHAPGWGLIGPAFPDEPIRHVDLAVPCRKCDQCLKRRARHWAHRAEAEIASAERTWFGTLTLAPEHQFRCITEARHRLAGQGLDWDKLEPDDAFKEQVKPLIREFQKFMKRVRKNHAGVRHCLVVERHKSGLPHLHLLVHETLGAVRHRHLTKSWQWGFSKFNLVAEEENTKAARYVTKYLTKSASARICASRGYGATQP